MSENENQTTGSGSGSGCSACGENAPLPFAFSMAFQPIVDLEQRAVFAYEALVRGTNGESAGSVIEQVNAENRYRFDQACRKKAIELGASLDRRRRLSINFMPNAVYDPASCLRTTLETARAYDFPLDNIIFEFTEGEEFKEVDHITGIIAEYRRHRILTAIDDFGAGFAGLKLLSRFQPDVIKIDMELTRGVHEQPMKQAIVQAIMDVCGKFSILVIAEGIETRDELNWLRQAGVRLFQGYLLARPAFEAFPEVDWRAVG